LGTMWVYDVDTTLRPYPLPLVDYLRQSFDPVNNSIRRYRPRFRIVSGSMFRRYFASDRSHMWNPVTRRYNAPPPPYECIVVKKSTFSSLSSSSNHHHDHDEPELRNTLPYYLHFDDDEDVNPPSGCPLPREALGTILSLEEFGQVERWRR
jgi:hypothetical protein